jgi:gamma-glutamylaminecyclotransferase
MGSVIFFYGTLKRGFGRNVILEDQKFLRDAKTAPKYMLYDLGAFPAMVKDDDMGVSVEGELWEVDEECLSYLCKIEGSPSFYKLESVTLDNNEIVQSFLFQRPVNEYNRMGACWK